MLLNLVGISLPLWYLTSQKPLTQLFEYSLLCFHGTKAILNLFSLFSLHIYIYIYIYVYIYMCIYLCIHIYVYIFMYTYVHTYITKCNIFHIDMTYNRIYEKLLFSSFGYHYHATILLLKADYSFF